MVYDFEKMFLDDLGKTETENNLENLKEGTIVYEIVEKMRGEFLAFTSIENKEIMASRKETRSTGDGGVSQTGITKDILKNAFPLR